jgi:hypothetical protein
MRLETLNPQFYGAGGEGIYNPTGRQCPVCPDTPDDSCKVCLGTGREFTPAEPRTGIGLSFDCPCQPCTEGRAKAVAEDPQWGRHQFRVHVSFANPVDGGAKWSEGPWWTRTGVTFDTLTLQPSILSDPGKGGCGWHGYVGGPSGNQPGEVVTV